MSHVSPWVPTPPRVADALNLNNNNNDRPVSGGSEGDEFEMTGDDHYRGPQLAAVDYTFAVLALVTISMRCAVRLFIVKGFGVDDWLMLGAAVCMALNLVAGIG